MPPTAVSPAEFLKTIWGESEGHAELTAIGKQGIKSHPWTNPGSIDSFLAASVNHNKHANVYMGVCLRREKWPRASGRIGIDGKPIFEYRGTEANALLSWAVWVEFDFLNPGDPEGHKGRVVDPELARKWLAEFPLNPSIIIKSGGGIQVYYLLKEPATGDDLWRVKAINKALVEHFTTEIQGKKFGADTQSVDLARILRIPGSMNLKYNPPRPCTVSWWHPENRYILDDFDFLPIPQIEKSLVPAPTSTPEAPPSSVPGELPKIPWIVLPQDAVDGIIEHVQALWSPGSRHDFTLKVAGMLAHANVSLESASTIIRTVALATNSDAEKRVKDVLDTYNKYVSGVGVTGKTGLEEFLQGSLPKDAHKKALQRVGYIAALIRRLPAKVKKAPAPPAEGGGDDDDDDGLGGEPDFEIKGLIKFDSRPARWTITIRTPTPEGEDLSATVETVNLVTFRLFQGFFFEQTHCMLSEITQRRWKNMLGACRNSIDVKETPKEARPEGAIETALEEFLSDSHENPEIGLLNSFPGFDESSRFFRFMALKDFMREQGLKIEDRTVFEHLKHLGFRSQVRRFGMKLLRVWMQSLEGGNGPQNENGHGGDPPEPPKPEKPLQSGPDASTPTLFKFDPESPKKDVSEPKSRAVPAAEIAIVPDSSPDFPPDQDVSEPEDEPDFGASDVQNE